MPSQKPIFNAALSQPLTAEEVETKLKEIPEWTRAGEAIIRTWTFSSYIEGLQFVNKVAFAAEANNHHPEVSLGYKRVEVRLWTHSANGLTELDFKIARNIDAILKDTPHTQL